MKYDEWITLEKGKLVYHKDLEGSVYLKHGSHEQTKIIQNIDEIRDNRLFYQAQRLLEKEENYERQKKNNRLVG